MGEGDPRGENQHRLTNRNHDRDCRPGSVAQASGHPPACGYCVGAASGRRPTRFERLGGEPAVETSRDAYAAKWKAEYEVFRKLLPEIGLKPQ